MDALLRLEGLSKVFTTQDVETHALYELHLSVREGEFLSIEGPSGSGKTTLLSILGLLDTPTRGRFTLGGEDVSRLSPRQRAAVRNRHVGFIFQGFNLLGDLTVEENVALPLAFRGLPAAERKAKAARALERVGMAHRAKHLPGQLSGGQQQRVAVARAVAGGPLLLLADEPTGNLDSKNGDAVMQLLRELNGGGVTVVMVTHNPAYARFATRSLHLLDGRVVGEGAHAMAPGQGG